MRGQRASDAGELVREQRFLVRFDNPREPSAPGASATEFRITEDGALVPGQIQVGDEPRRSRVPGTGEVTAFTYAGEVVAIELPDGTTYTSTLFGTRGAVASALLAVGLLVLAAHAAVRARRRPSTRVGRGVAVVAGALVATGLAWLYVVSALPLSTA